LRSEFRPCTIRGSFHSGGLKSQGGPGDFERAGHRFTSPTWSETERAGPIPTVFGAAAVAAGGFHLALRSPGRFRHELMKGPPNGADPSRTQRNAKAAHP
jgi:hypothetical protein